MSLRPLFGKQNGQTKVAHVAGTKRGGEGEERKAQKRGKGKGVFYPLSPIILLFPLPPSIPYPLSTPATQVKLKRSLGITFFPAFHKSYVGSL